MKYYVYNHVDPETKTIMYIGIGQFDRAWNVRNNQRKESHTDWIKKQYAKGYTLSDVVVVVYNNLSKQEAISIEFEEVKKHTPEFNCLLNPNHWNLSRTYDKETASFVRTLSEMGYGYKRIAYLLGSNSPETHHMKMKRMILNVSN